MIRLRPVRSGIHHDQECDENAIKSGLRFPHAWQVDAVIVNAKVL
jgi:hypothetical protein